MELAHVASVNKLNETIAGVRGVSLATVESYARVLRKGGVLPETTRGSGASPTTPWHAAMVLFAVMRGSPTNAEINAREVGGLIAHSGGALMEPILFAELDAIGWQDGLTLAEAVASLIHRMAAGTLSEIVDERKSIWIEVDRYWTTATLIWNPAPALASAMLAAYTDVFGLEAAKRMLDPDGMGNLRQPLHLTFHSPHLYEARINYGVDNARNKAAHAAFRKSKAERLCHDVFGTEKVSERTLAALSELYPVNAERQSTVTVPGVSTPGQNEDFK